MVVTIEITAIDCEIILNLVECLNNFFPFNKAPYKLKESKNGINIDITKNEIVSVLFPLE